MNKEEFALEGTKEVLEALDSLEPKVLINIIRAIERKSLNENIIKPLRAAIPYESLKGSVGIAKDKDEKTGYYAGIKLTKRRIAERPPDGVILRWIEKGTDIRTTKKGANRGQVTGMNVVIPTIQNNISGIIEDFNNDFGSEVEKILQRRLKKINKTP